MKKLLILACLLALAGCSPNDGHYRGERVRIRVNGRDGYLMRRTSLLEGGDFVVEYADSTGEIHWDRFQSNELQFED